MRRRGRSRSTDPDSAKEAGYSIDATQSHQIIYQVMAQEGSVGPHGKWLSTLDLEKVLRPHGMDKWSISSRLPEMAEDGYIERKQMPGLNSSGRIRNLLHCRIIKPKDPNKES